MYFEFVKSWTDSLNRRAFWPVPGCKEFSKQFHKQNVLKEPWFEKFESVSFQIRKIVVKPIEKVPTLNKKAKLMRKWLEFYLRIFLM